MRPVLVLDRLPPVVRALADKADLIAAQQTAAADAQAGVPVLVASPFANPGGTDTSLAHGAQLKADWNSVLIQVTQGSGGWSLHFRVTAPDGLPIPGLEFSDAPPERLGAGQ